MNAEFRDGKISGHADGSWTSEAKKGQPCRL